MEKQSDVILKSAMDTTDPVAIEIESTDSQLNSSPKTEIVQSVKELHNSDINETTPSTCSNTISLVNYDDTSDEYISSDENESHVQIPASFNYRETSLSENESSTDSESDDSDPSKSVCVTKPVIEIPRVKGELTIDDLPPIEDLAITVRQEETLILGKIQSIIDQLVVVQSFPNTTAVDIDSVLFLEEGRKTLGKVFDVVGPISEPLYCVRFNSNDQIKEKQICVGANVYYAPKTVHTAFIFLPALLRVKGSDASWEHDVEPPEKYLDYSDDEAERSARKGKKKEECTPNQEQNKLQQYHVKQKTLANRERKRALCKRNFKFSVQDAPPAGMYCSAGPSQELFYQPFYNQTDILPYSYSNVHPSVHQQFPNTGQSFPQPFHFNSGPRYSTNPWNGNSSHSSIPVQNIDTTRPPPPLPPQPNQKWDSSNPPAPGTF